MPRAYLTKGACRQMREGKELRTLTVLIGALLTALLVAAREDDAPSG